MTGIVNLRRVKKQRARAEAAQAAAENRARHGRTPAERRTDNMERDRTERMLDGAQQSETDPKG